MNRRQLIGLGLIGLSGGTVFGSGAFTQVRADRDFAITIAESDADSQLVIDPTAGIDSEAVSLDNGRFVIDEQGDLPPDGKTAYGRFDGLYSPDTIQEGVFAVRNENDTQNPISITLGVDLNQDAEAVIELGAIGPTGARFVADTEGEDTTTTISPVEYEESVEIGLIIDTSGAETLDATVSFEAERLSGPEPPQDGV